MLTHLSLSGVSKGEWFHPGGVCGTSYAELSASGAFARRSMMVVIVVSSF